MKLYKILKSIFLNEIMFSLLVYMMIKVLIANLKLLLRLLHFMQSSFSPSKRSSFRSRTKGKDPKQIKEQNQGKKMKEALSFKMYMKEFPLGISEDIIKIVELFEPIHHDFMTNLDNLRLYKSNLAISFQNNWARFMEILRTIIMRMNRRNDKLIEEKQQKIVQVLNINSQKQEEIKRLKDKIDNIEHLRELQNAQLAVADNEVKLVNKEMSDIYAILQNDMGKILKYLTSVEQSRNQQAKQGTDKVYTSLDGFNTLLNSMQSEQKQTANTLNTMRQMIKAMARSTKISTGTQVDQSQLQTQAANIFSSDDNSTIPFQVLDSTALNTVTEGKYDHVLDKLKMKDKQHPHETYHPKKSTQKPWALTPTLLIFLENMSKQNEAGRVLPWQYMKTLINQIYLERIKSESQVIAGIVGNSMMFDQFVVFYFLKKFRIRRLTQVKLLEFIISLKYYSKFWIKAETFCNMMDVMKYIPSHDSGDTYNYRMDFYTQNFFLQVYKRIISFDLIHEDDGTVYVPTKKVRKLMKLMLFFTQEMNLSRLYAKLDKDIRIYEKVEHADFDYALFLFLQEYFSVRKKMSMNIGRYFSRGYEKNQGFLSIDQLQGIFNEFSKIYNAGEPFPQKYPVESPLQLSKIYLYAITSGKNDYQINSINFVQACQRYGFDSPFPFMHKCPKIKDQKKKHIQTQSDKQKEEKPQIDENKNLQIDAKRKKKTTEESKPEQISAKNEEFQNSQRNLNKQRVDATSKLFSQHFTLLKQLYDYTQIFEKTLSKQEDPQLLWKAFNQIKFVLQRGCKFLKYPLVDRD